MGSGCIGDGFSRKILDIRIGRSSLKEAATHVQLQVAGTCFDMTALETQMAMQAFIREVFENRGVNT